jgi:uncharacterized phiE125 gp8 family phage protein
VIARGAAEIAAPSSLSHEGRFNMPSILVTPPQAEPVTLADAKAQLRISHADDDQLIGTLISSARRVVEGRTALCLIRQQWMQFRDAWPEDGVMALPLWPIISVEELAVFGEDDQKAVIEPSHYVVDAASRPARVMLRGSRLWQRPGRAMNGIALTVEAGFGATPESVPEPLRLAMLQLVAHWYENRGTDAPPPPPVTVDALLAPYRWVRL